MTMRTGLRCLKSGSNMGYYTYFIISLHGEEEKVEAFKKDLLEISKGDDGEVDDALDELLKYQCVEARLYNLEQWIDAVALKHPDVLIVLDGDGEESDDCWEARWKGDQKEIQRAIIPPFTNPALFLDKEKQN